MGSIFGFALGLAILFAAYVGAPGASVAETHAASMDGGCVAENVALDEGYGVTRTETHVVCANQAADKASSEEKKN